MEENTINIEETQSEQDSDMPESDVKMTNGNQVSSPVANLAEQKEEQTADKKRISKSRTDPSKKELPETRAERNTSYINKKEQEFKSARQNGLVRAGVTWNQVRHQINSGLYLGLTTEQVDLYANFFYSYEQMEIIKFALYDNTPNELLKELINPKLPIKEMLLIKSNSTIVKRLTELFLRQDAYLNDAEKIRRELAEKEAEAAAVKSLTEELQAKLAASEARVTELHSQLQIYKKKHGTAEAPAAAVNTNEKIKKTVSDATGTTVQAEQAGDASPSGMDHADNNKKKKSGGIKKFFHKQETPILSGKQLPADFDLDDCVKKANLSPDQMQVLNFAVTNGFSDGDIKDLIEADLPADRMKALLEFKLTREAMKGREEQ